MATKWNTVKFIQAWMNGTLGRKRVHGTYRVLVGDHCQLLVRASTQYGRPDGSTLIGINLSTAKELVCFMHNYNTNCFTYGMNRDLDIYNIPKLPANVLLDTDAALLDSGVIDADDTEVLIELGDKPYLLHKLTMNDGSIGKWNAITRFSSLDKLSSRVASIEEAKEQVKDPEGMEQLCSLWWIDKQADGFKPPELEERYTKILTSPVNALDYGYLLSDCSVANASVEDSDVGVLVPAETLLTEPHDSRARRYTLARKYWNDACEKLKSRAPLEYEGLSTKKTRYSYHISVHDRVGWIVRTATGVFISGRVQNKDNWDDVTQLDGWHKLHARVNRVKLG